MTNEMKWALLAAYFSGFLGSFYIGMRVEKWRFMKHFRERLNRAYSLGWDAGFTHVTRIQQQRVDMESAVRILQGEDADSDRPFPGS